MLKYEVPNQLTGVPESAASWEEAIALKQKLIQDFMEHMGDLHPISVLIQNEDGSWKQTLADENGYPIPDWIPE